MKAGWKSVSVPRAQPGLRGWSRQGRVEGESIHVYITTQLAPVARPYMSISGGGRAGQLEVAQTKVVSGHSWQSGF